MNLEVDKLLETYYQENRLDEGRKQQIEASIKDFVNYLKSLDYTLFQQSTIYYLYFGSWLNGFGTKSSDVDFSIMTNSYIDEIKAIRILHGVMDSKKNEQFKKDKQIIKARVPVIKLEDKKYNVEYDLCVNNILGVINTRLMQAYSKLHPKIQQGGIMIKQWGKVVGIVNTSQFSSYSLVIMWICFLQRKYGIANLQDQKYNIAKLDCNMKIKRNIAEWDSEFQTNTFFLYKGEIFEQLKQESAAILDNQPLYKLLAEFWEYYDQNGEAVKHPYKISLNLQIEKKQNEYQFSISDPFDHQHDPGKKVGDLGKKQLVFQAAAQFIQSNNLEQIYCLFHNKTQ